MVAVVKKRDVSLQTTNDILTDEAPHFAARPPLCHKNEMIPSVLLFRDIDRKMAQTGELNSVSEIGQFVCKACKNDLFKIRAIFIWVTGNIRYNSELRESNLVSAEIIERREGSSKEFSRLFVDLCRAVGVRAKVIEGFTRGYDYRPGHNFSLGNFDDCEKVFPTFKRDLYNIFFSELDAISSWNAVFVLSSWRFIDLALAAGYTDASGEFHASLNEHYFLTDPSMMIWTHFPCSKEESEYER